MRAVSMLSGGLDSILATRLILEQGIEVFALNSVSIFCTCTPRGRGCSAARTEAERLGIPLKTVDASRELLELAKAPPHGHGSGMNPCIDCRINLFRRGKQYMEEIGAAFLVTGEVLGERPMSQRRDAMALIEREAGLEGRIVRPLSARLLEPSIPEREGWIDRAALRDFSGRRRLPQIELARSMNVGDYPCPAGGCRLTDPGFATRIRDLIEHDPGCDVNDAQTLTVGRQFRLAPSARAVVGRDEAENHRLRALARKGDLLLELADLTGPLTLLRGRPPADGRPLLLSAAITARYSKARGSENVAVRADNHTGKPIGTLRVSPAGDDTCLSMMVRPGRGTNDDSSG